MSKKLISRTLKILLSFLMLISIFITTYVLPRVAEDTAKTWEEIEYLKVPMLVVGQLLMVLFILGLGIIIYLLFLFDRKETFSKQFARGVNWLSAMCVMAVFMIAVAIGLLVSVGGPGPGGIWLFCAGIVILILGLVLYLISTIINDAIYYKEEIDLTV